MKILLNDLINWMNWFENIILRKRIFIIWIKLKVLLKYFRENILLLINWNKYKGKLNLRDRNELWNIFISINLQFHHWLYSKKKISIINESLSIIIIDIMFIISKIK